MKLSSATVLAAASMASTAPTVIFGQSLDNDGSVGVSSKILSKHLANEEIFEHQRRHLSEDENEEEENKEDEEQGDNGDEGEDDEDQDDDMNEFLSKYSMKFVACNPDGVTVNPETGDNEYGGSVVIRMCESDSCSSSNKL